MIRFMTGKNSRNGFGVESQLVHVAIYMFLYGECSIERSHLVSNGIMKLGCAKIYILAEGSH